MDVDKLSPPSYDPALLFDDDSAAAAAIAASIADHGWKKVTYAKRQRRPPPPAAPVPGSHDPDLGGRHVFDSVDQKAGERRRALESAAASAAAEAGALLARSRPSVATSDDDEDGIGTEDPAKENGEAAAVVVKKVKQKKPKITVADAAAKIDSDNLSAFLIDISASFESQPDIQLMRFADYFARSFSTVSASQFPWTKIFKESPVAKIIDIPLCHISESVYKTSVDWIAKRSAESLGDFVLWCLDAILADLATQLATAKGSKKSVQQSPKAQVAIFVVVAMALRRKPDILINLLPKIKENSKYQGQEKLVVIVWIIAQASQGDLVVGMYAWAHYLFPLVCGKANANPHSRDLVLQSVERMLSRPKAQSILLNGSVRKGARLVPPPAFDLLMRAAFPASSARIKATERFEALYPALKEVALTGSPGTKTTKQASQELLPSAVKAMQENNPELAKEAAGIFIWCLTQNAECYTQWEKLHLENVEASVHVLRKLSDEWKEWSAKLAPLDTLRDTLSHLRAKNEEALSGAVDASSHASFKEADKYCKVLMGRSAGRSSCLKGGMVVLAIAIAAGFFASSNMESLDWNKLALDGWLPSVLKMD